MSEEDEPERIETAPIPLPFTMSGFDREDDARQFADILGGVIRAISGYVNLERLAAVSVAGDYAQALADVDRGFDNLNPLVRSNNDTVVGVAMAVAVIRDGALKKHLVFNADHVLPIWVCDRDSEQYRRAIYIVAHECAHVADLRDLDLAFPEMLLKERVSGMAALIEPHASSLWSEYTACRQSAPFGREQGELYIESAQQAVTDGQAAVRRAIMAYRRHGDIDRLISEALEPATRAIRLCAYVVGHLDAFDEDMPDDLRDALANADLLDLTSDMRDGLRALWAARGEWTSRTEFTFMNEIIRDAIGIAGMIITDQPDGGAHISVPFTTKNPTPL